MGISFGTIYWITRLDAILGFFICLLFFGIVSAIITTLIIAMNDEFIEKLRIIVISWIVVLILSVFAVLTPSSKEFAACIAIPKIVNNEHVVNIADKSMNIIELKAQEWIDDLTKKKDEKKDK